MNLLFPDTPPYPRGFQYIPGFIDTVEEAALIDAIQKIHLTPMVFHGYEARRKTESFGYDYSFEHRALSQGKAIPPDFQAIIDKSARVAGLNPAEIVELLVTEYPPGAVINWHRDAPPFEVILGISLLEDCIFKFRPHNESARGRKSVISFPVARRSIYVIAGEARSDWQHSIAPVRQTRYSVTLRTLTMGRNENRGH
jgi:alkylated DNA repair dioxygenase AlkB